jgi:2-oxoglutarate ferredoxin oxidoreductase subunit gamma
MTPTEQKTHVEIRLSGFGGQGVMLAAVVLGRAAAVHEGRNAVMAQSYGPESRGGASSAEVIIDDAEIDYPHAVAPDVIVVFSQEAYVKYGLTRPAGTLLIADKDLVVLDAEAEKGKRVLRCPFTGIAEKVGRKVVLNMVALGFLCRATGLVSAEALKASVAVSVPKGTEELNVRAFEAGYNYTEGLPG